MKNKFFFLLLVLSSIAFAQLDAIDEPIPVTTVSVTIPVTTSTTATTTTVTTTTIAATTTTTTTTVKTTTTLVAEPVAISEKVDRVYSKVETLPVRIGIFGTEYQAGDSATTFIQLTRNYYPINNATCYLTAYYPDKTLLFNHVVMSYLLASDGLYYYDYTVPSQLGVYMLSVTCVLPQTYYIENFLNYNALEDWSNVIINSSKVYLNNITNSTPSADARVDSYFPTTNYGTVNSLAAGLTTTPFTMRTYMSFELNYLRGRNISSAYLYLRNYFTTGVVNFTVNLANASWNETTITWNNQPTFSTVNRTINTFSGFGVWRRVDVTNLTRMIAEGRRDYGFVLADANESVAGNHNVYFQSREDATLKPYLEVTYGSSSNFGFVKTIPYNLTQDSWLTFSADYSDYQGSTNYAILNGNNNTLCSSLGSIYSCAFTTPSVKMYANLSRPGSSNATPEIDRIYVQMATVTQEEIRGGGELHVSAPVVVSANISDISEDVWHEFFVKGTPPTMESTQYTCKDNVTLIKNLTFEFCRDTSCKDYSKVEDVRCDYGCDMERNECIQSPASRMLLVIGIIAALVIAFVVIRWWFR